MPVLDGWQATALIRKLPPPRCDPTIIGTQISVASNVFFLLNHHVSCHCIYHVARARRSYDCRV
jgi:hypothetical protein